MAGYLYINNLRLLCRNLRCDLKGASMNDEPFGRQPKPVTVRIDGTDQQDIDYWTHLFMRGAERHGDDVGNRSGIVGKHREFTIYPRAVND